MNAADRIDTAFPRVRLRDAEYVARVLAGVGGPYIDNIVTTCKLDLCGVSAADLAHRLVGKHKPDEFKADASIHLGPGHCSATYLMFPTRGNGCMIMTGVRTPGLVMAAAYRLVKYFSERMNVRSSISRCVITNMHAVFYMNYPIHLEELMQVYPRATYYKDVIKCLVMPLHIPDPNERTANAATEEAPPPNNVFHRVYPEPPTSVVTESPPVLNNDDDEDKEEDAFFIRLGKRISRPEAPEKESEADADDEAETEGESAKKRRRVNPLDDPNAVVYTEGFAEEGLTKEELINGKKKRKVTQAKKPKVPVRKIKTIPTITFSIWATGAVCVQGGRSVEHIQLASKMAAEFLAHFTMCRV